MVLRKGILNGVLKKRVISKILLSTILFVLVFGVYVDNVSAYYKVTNFQATKTSDSQILLTWQVDKDESGYFFLNIVDRDQNKIAKTLHFAGSQISYSGNSASYKISGNDFTMDPQHNYDFNMLVTRDQYQLGVKLAEGLTATIVNKIVESSKPNNVKYGYDKGDGSATIWITWEPSGGIGTLKYYTIYKRTDDASGYVLVKSYTSDMSTYRFTDTGSYGKQYVYYVSTKGSFGSVNADNSVPVTVTLPGQSQVDKCASLLEKYKSQIQILENSTNGTQADQTTRDTIAATQKQIEKTKQEIIAAKCDKIQSGTNAGMADTNYTQLTKRSADALATAKAVSIDPDSNSKNCQTGESWLGFLGQSLAKTIQQIPCVIVGIVLNIIEFIQQKLVSLFSESVPLVRHITNSNFKIADVWKIMLQLVDYAVVAFLIFISFANILRIQVDTYAIKKTIPTLVLGVIAANLSWFICKEIINFADILVQWIGSGLLTSAGDVTIPTSEGLFDALFHQIYDSVKTGASNIPLSGETLLVGLGLIFTGLNSFTFMIAIVGVILVSIPMAIFVILGFLFLARMVIVDFLVIASPLAFIALAFPMTQKLFQQWWSQFTRWVFMAPLAYLLLAFAVFIGAKIGANPTSTTGTGDIIFSGILRYVMMGAAMYFAIKIPSMLGGGIMNAWGGLGAKFGKFLGKAGDKKIGDWSQNGLRFWGKQWVKPSASGARYSVRGLIGGWMKGAQDSDAQHMAESMGGGKGFREIATGALGRTYAGLKSGEILKILTNKSLSKEERAFRMANLVGGPKVAEMGSEAIHTAQKDIEREAAIHNDEKLLQDQINDGIKHKNPEVRRLIMAAAFRRMKLDPNTEKDFYQSFGATQGSLKFFQAAVGLSNTERAVTNHPNGVAWINTHELGSDGRVRERQDIGRMNQEGIDNYESANSLRRGDKQISAVTNMLNSIADKEHWGAQQEAGFQWMEKLAREGKLDNNTGTKLNQFRAKRSEFGKLSTDIQNSFQSQFNRMSTKNLKLKIDEGVDVLLSLKPKDIKDEHRATAHLLNWIKNGSDNIIENLDFSDQEAINIGRAIQNTGINPLITVKPKIQYESNDSLANMTSSDMNKELFSRLDGAPDRIEQDISLGANIHKDRSQYESAFMSELGSMNADLRSMVKQKLNVNGQVKLGKIASLDMNDLRRNLINQGTLPLKEMMAQLNKLQKIKSSMGKLDHISEVTRNASGIVSEWKRKDESGGGKPVQPT